MIYRWAQGPRPATDYALLFGAAFFVAMPLRVAAPALATMLGWPAYLALEIAFYIFAVAILCEAVRRTERGSGRTIAGLGAGGSTSLLGALAMTHPDVPGR